MTARMLFFAAIVVTLGAIQGVAQEAQSKPESKSKPSPTAQTAPQRPRQDVNVKVDVVLTEQKGSEAPTKRIVSVVVADGFMGRVRSGSVMRGDMVGSVHPIPLNVDASPELLPNNKIKLQFSLQYDLPGRNQGGPGTLVSSSINQNVLLIVENGKPMVATQSADPVGDRKVTVEVTATILK